MGLNESLPVRDYMTINTAGHLAGMRFLCCLYL
jgi:hypothetical protein